MRRAAAWLSFMGLMLFAAPACHAAGARAATAELPGSDHYTGLARGTVIDHGMNSDPSDGLSLSTDSEIRGEFTFEFQVLSDGQITGDGEGHFDESFYMADGSWEKGPLGCEVPITGAPFKVAVSGQATASSAQARFLELALRLTMLDATETSPQVPCGQEFSIFATTSTTLSESLEAVEEPSPAFAEPSLTFVNGELEDSATKSVPFDNGEGSSGTRDGTWEVELQPSLEWVPEFKGTLASAGSAEQDAALVQAAVAAACSTVPAVLQNSCVTTFAGLSSGSTALSLAFGWLGVDPVDKNYRSVAKPAVGALPRILPAHGLSRADAAKLNALLAAQARSVALGSAMATAVNRFAGAAVAHSAAWMHRQRLAARTYAGKLAASLAVDLADLRAAQRALSATPFGSGKLSAQAIHALQQSIVAHGIPAGVSADLSRLRLPAADARALRLKLERADPALIGTPSSLASALDPAVSERDIRAAIHALRSIASGHEK